MTTTEPRRTKGRATWTATSWVYREDGTRRETGKRVSSDEPCRCADCTG